MYEIGMWFELRIEMIQNLWLLPVISEICAIKTLIVVKTRKDIVTIA